MTDWKRRGLSFILLLCLFILLLPTAAFATNITQEEALDWARSKVGTKIDADGAYGAQCVDFIMAYYQFLGASRVLGNGCDYATNSLPSGWKRIQGATPQPGDILVYRGAASNSYCGHVGIYESDYVHYHQNIPGRYGVVICTWHYNYNGLYWGVVRPNFAASPKQNATEQPEAGLTELNSIPYATLSDGVYALQNKSTGTFATAAEGTSFFVSPQTGSPAGAYQQWRLTQHAEDGTYEIKNTDTGLVIEAGKSDSDSAQSSAEVRLAQSNDSESQRFYLIHCSDGYYRMVDKSSQRSMEAVAEAASSPSSDLDLGLFSDSRSASGTAKVRQSADNGTDAQKWALIPLVSAVPDSNPYLVRFDANGGSNEPSSQLKLPNVTLTLSSSEPVLAGFIFLGWADTPNAETVAYHPGSIYTTNSNATLYAVWQEAQPCEHTFITSAALQSPTCTDSGIIQQICEACGEIQEQTEEALGHQYSPANGICVRCGAINPNYHSVHFERNAKYTQGQFTDVSAQNWYAAYVAGAFELGLMRGSTESTFNPSGDVTVAEAVTMAARIHSIYTTGGDHFVQSGKWYQVYLDYAYQNGIISRECYSSDVTQKISRAQFAEILANSLPKKALGAINPVEDGSIPDVDSGVTYADEVYLLYRAGILTGSDSSGAYSPRSNITRAEAATIANRMAESDSRVSASPSD
ncbi:MAG: S-layer homology domain-containing protein [Clostridia bacterium]|nr:S-layer homology domain-containing protein [Clostridia bacterium]